MKNFLKGMSGCAIYGLSCGVGGGLVIGLLAWLMDEIDVYLATRQN